MSKKFYCIWAVPCKDKAEAAKNFCTCEGRGKRPREDYAAIERAIHRSQEQRDKRSESPNERQNGVKYEHT